MVDLLKINGVDVEESLEFWGDLESYNENLQEFRNSLEEKLENLKFYLTEGDCNNYAILAHSLKSEAKYLGFKTEAEVFLEHELKSKDNDLNFIKNDFKNINDTINKIITLLDKYFNGDDTDIRKKKILIADDSSIILNFISSNIGNEFEPIRANNGKDTIEKIKNNDFYAILLDLNMPSMNGFEVLDYLKDNDLLEKIPVVVITGDDTEDTIKKVFTYPILDVLNKPFNEEKLRRILVTIKSFYDHK